MTQKIFSHVKVVEQFKEPSSDSRKFLSTSKKLLKTDLISGINNFCTARKDPYLPESPLSCVSFSNSRQHPSYLYSQVNSFNKTVQQIAPAKPKSVAYTPRSTYVELPIPWQVDSGHPPKPKFLAPPRTELLCSCEPGKAVYFEPHLTPLDDKLNLDHFINSHQQNLKHLESKISPLPRTMSSQQSIWNHLTMLVSQMIREYVQAQNLELELSNEAETCEILLQFFFQWIDKIWFNSIEASLKRVDCPPEAFEPYIKSFADHQTSIEKIKTIENAGAVHLDRISKNIEKPLRDAKGNRNSKLNRSEFIDSNTSKPITKSWALHSSKHTVSNSSVEALRELGLDDSIFGITRNTTHEEINKLVEASQNPDDEDQENYELSLDTLRKQMLKEAAARAQEANAVRRRQGKLTREVAINDVLVALKYYSIDMPRSLYIDLVRFFQLAVSTYFPEEIGGSLIVPTLIKNEFLCYKNVCTNEFVDANALSGGEKEAAASSAGGSNDKKTLKRRFHNTWLNQAFLRSFSSDRNPYDMAVFAMNDLNDARRKKWYPKSPYSYIDDWQKPPFRDALSSVPPAASMPPFAPYSLLHTSFEKAPSPYIPPNALPPNVAIANKNVVGPPENLSKFVYPLYMASHAATAAKMNFMEVPYKKTPLLAKYFLPATAAALNNQVGVPFKFSAKFDQQTNQLPPQTASGSMDFLNHAVESSKSQAAKNFQIHLKVTPPLSNESAAGPPDSFMKPADVAAKEFSVYPTGGFSKPIQPLPCLPPPCQVPLQTFAPPPNQPMMLPQQVHPPPYLPPHIQQPILDPASAAAHMNHFLASAKPSRHLYK